MFQELVTKYWSDIVALFDKFYTVIKKYILGETTD